MKTSDIVRFIIIALVLYRLFSTMSVSRPLPLEPYSTEQLKTERMIYKEQTGGPLKTASMYDMAFPPRTVMMWWDTNSSSESAVPPGWALCNGQTVMIDGVSVVTPNLSGRFPLGWNAATNSERPVNTTGGEETVTLTANQIPTHSHTIQVYKRQTNAICDQQSNSKATPETWDWTTRTTTSTGGNQAHNNMPPFVVIKFIIKL